MMPNGLTKIFGPVSSCCADAGVLTMNNLNKYLITVQCNHFCTNAGKPIIYGAFSNSAYNLWLQCIQSYYSEFNGVKLDAVHAKCNMAMQSAKIGDGEEYSLLDLQYEGGQQNCDKQPHHIGTAVNL